MTVQKLNCSFNLIPSFLIGSKFLAVLVGVAIGFSVISRAAEPSKMEWIVIRPDGRGFMERDSGRPYIVFGTNYYDPRTGWAPKIWRRFDSEKVRQHFQVMSELGVNCARIFLTAGSFQPNAETVEEQALEKLTHLTVVKKMGNFVRVEDLTER